MQGAGRSPFGVSRSKRLLELRSNSGRVPPERHRREGTRSAAQGRMLGPALLVTFGAFAKSDPL